MDPGQPRFLRPSTNFEEAYLRNYYELTKTVLNYFVWELMLCAQHVARSQAHPILAVAVSRLPHSTAVDVWQNRRYRGCCSIGFATCVLDTHTSTRIDCLVSLYVGLRREGKTPRRKRLGVLQQVGITRSERSIEKIAKPRMLGHSVTSV